MSPPGNADPVRFGTSDSGEPLELQVSDLLRHLTVSGPTGTGKSSFIRALVEQLQYHVPILVLDTADDFVGMARAVVLDPETDGIPFDPRDIPIDPYSGRPVTMREHATLLQELLLALRPQIGPRQLDVLARGVRDMLRQRLELPDLLAVLRTAVWADPAIQLSLLAQLGPVCSDPGLKSSRSVRARDLVTGVPGLRVVRLRSAFADSELARILFCLTGVLQASREVPPESGPRLIIVLEELHRFAQPLLASLLDRIVREGRKYGLVLWTSNQDSPSGAILSNSAMAVQLLPGGQPGEALVSFAGSAPERVFLVQRQAPPWRPPSEPEAIDVPRLRAGRGPVSRFLRETN